MALERQIVTIPLAQGLDTKTDAKQVGGGKLLALQNGVFTTGKKLRKRYGTSVLAAANTATTGCYTRGDELVVAGTDANGVGTLTGYSPDSSTWAARGQFVRTEIAQAPMLRTDANTYEGCIAVHSSGIGCLVYPQTIPGATPYSISALLFDVATMRPITTLSLASSASAMSAKVVTMGGEFVVAYGSASTVYVVMVSPTLLTTHYPNTMVTGGAWTSHTAFDLLTNAAGTRCYVVYPAATGLDVSVKYTTPGAPATWSGATALGMALGADKVNQLALAEDAGNSNNIAILSSTDTSAVWISAINTSMAVVTAKVSMSGASGATIDAIGLVYGSTPQNAVSGMRAYVSETSTDATLGLVSKVKVYIATGAGYTFYSVTARFYNYRMTVKPFVRGGFVYLGVGVYRGGSARYIAIDYGGWAGSSPWMVGKYGATDGSGGAPFQNWPAGNSAITQAAVVNASSYMFTVGVSLSLSGISSNVGLDAGTLTFPTTPAVSVEMYGSLYFGGGMPLLHDGTSVLEVGFNHDPFMVATASGAGGTIPAGSYGYVCLFEHTDATGCVHRSAVSPVSTVALTGATSSVALTVSNYTNTLRAYPNYAGNTYFHRVAIYRTIVAGSVYYRLGTVDCAYDATSVTFTDTGAISDTALAANTTVYTTGGVLDAVQPPAFSALTAYRNRVVGISSENPNQFWYSKQVAPGQTADFSDFLVQNVDAVGGECTAVAALDDKLIVFKPGVSYYMTGTGPDSTGAANDFSVPILINTNSGCTEPRSVITAADGVLYQSAKGIFLLNRSLQDSYVGAGVEAYNSATVRSSVMTPGTNEVRFVLSTGTVLVYDFLYDQWATFTGLSAVDSVAWSGVVSTLSASGVVSYENPAVFTDNGTAIELRFTTGWLSGGDLQSFLRIYKLMVLGTWKSSHTLNVWVQYDYRTDTVAANKYAIVATGDPSPGQFQYRVNLSQQKAEAVSITVYDSSSTGESLDISALSFEVGSKRGPMKLPAAGNV
jgi:hypothetical protein